MYRSARLELRLTDTEIRMLDKIRGPSSRSAWIRNQILRTYSDKIGPIAPISGELHDHPKDPS